MNKAYPKYKSSGVEWLGDVPEHWEVKRLKDLLKVKKGAIKTGPFGSQLLSSEMYDEDVKVYNQKSVITKDFEYGENYISFEKFKELKEFQAFPGDFLITTRGTIGRCAILPENAEQGILHPCLMRLQTSEDKVYDRFLEILIEESTLILEQLRIKSNGTTIEVIYQDSLKNVTVLLPPLPEQQAIAAFLDRETGRIDALIAKKERLLELLAEQRRALISRAVTKGLDASVKLKPSGVEWLGDVPEHWEVKRLKYSASTIMGQSPNSDEYSDDADLLPFLQGNADFTDRYPSPHVYCETANKKVPTGSLLISVRAPVGALNEADQEYGIGRGLCAVISRDGLDKRFSWFSIQITRTELSTLATGSTYDAVSADEVGNMLIPLPPLPEQQAIAAFLDRETAKIDALSAKVVSVIERLKEYRTALISSAVTGKIDVREAV